jgi:imidazolonepropionase-like amidohydrolase/ABC-type multidrug transport system permease subunit
MNAYLAYIRTNLRLTMRDRTVIFFNYLFPLIFFFIFGQMMKADRGGAAFEVVTMVLTIGVLGSGFFGAGIRAVMDREQNILRRFKVAPITPGPILASSLVTGVVHYIPVALGIVILGHLLYKMPWPERPFSLMIFILAGVLAFRSVGMIIASVANSMAESQIIIQLLYFPMLFLSGATLPIGLLPEWVQVLSQYLPSTHLFAGLETILVRKEGLLEHATGFAALLLTSVVCLFIANKLFRWEKEERIAPASKLWILGVLTPFVLLGTWQAFSKDNLRKSKLVERQLRRDRNRLIKNVRIFVGDGQVIEQAHVLLKAGKIDRILTGAAPDAKDLSADEIDAIGKTLMPGLIDTHVHLAAPGGLSDRKEDYDLTRGIPRRLAAYLFSGVTAVRSVGDPLASMLREHARLDSGEILGAELFFAGPLFTAEGGHGTEFFKYLPDNVRKAAEEQSLRLPKTPAEAQSMVAELKRAGVHHVKAILESGSPGMLFNRLDASIYQATGAAARQQGLPFSTHISTNADIEEALAAGTTSIEHLPQRDQLPPALIEKIKSQGVYVAPTLAVMEGAAQMAAGRTEWLDRPLVRQAGPEGLIQTTKQMLASEKLAAMKMMAPRLARNVETVRENLRLAQQAGVVLVAGTDSGNNLLLHGAGVHRELQLWVQAGVPARVALQAATYHSAQLMRIDQRVGLVKAGYEATLLLVDGNPLEDIGATERISSVFLKGERVDRSSLFEDFDKKR